MKAVQFRGRYALVWCVLVVIALLMTACAGQVPQATRAPTSATGQQTFGTVPCAQLLSLEEVQAVVGQSFTVIDIVEEGTCVYEDESGLALLTVILTTDAGGNLACTAPDGTYLGEKVDEVAGAGDMAVWSETAGAVCFVKGAARVQISFGSPLPGDADQKTTAVDLARKAAARLP